MAEKKYQVPNISCGHCVHTIQTALRELEGVSEAWADAEAKTVEVAFDPPADDEKIKALLAEINYPAQ